MSTVLNRASVKRYALAVSAARRAGKFSRVGQEFFERCETRLESELRALVMASPPDLDVPASELTFITKLARNRANEKLEILAQKIIYSEVLKHPSLGVTLK